ncbi:hypothetical protein DY000_02055479 [Brassica cretica]|uniref:Uncharacterized protein n=1 Tax=Brassica cretica TaxID=69181 RepID=A0ABQ7AJK4_BRACR|nr:hypothetical protein DY000_02055479 [Brassica cretica]
MLTIREILPSLNRNQISLFNCIATMIMLGMTLKCYKIACNYVSDCQTKVNRGLASLRCPKCGNVNATEVARLAFLILTFLHRLSFHSKSSALQYMYLSEILAYDKDEKATLYYLVIVSLKMLMPCKWRHRCSSLDTNTTMHAGYNRANPQFRSEDLDYKFIAMRQSITFTKIVSIALLRPLPQAVEIPIMQVMIVTSFLGQV